MNYPAPSSNNGSSYSFAIQLGLFVLLFFFIAFFLFEMVSFVKLFEVRTVINPAINLIK